MNKRKYTKTRRAEQQQQTRERILASVVALHEELGPAHTTVKAVAEKAGVQRLTVYRYFPDDSALFKACTAHWLALNPPPALAEWAAIEDGPTRTRAALLAFYRYYRRTRQMWDASYRDVHRVAALQPPMAEFETYLDRVRDDLVNVWKLTAQAKDDLALTLRHGLRFSTWQSFSNEKLKDEGMVELVESWLAGIIAARSPSADEKSQHS